MLTATGQTWEACSTKILKPQAPFKYSDNRIQNSFVKMTTEITEIMLIIENCLIHLNNGNRPNYNKFVEDATQFDQGSSVLA